MTTNHQTEVIGQENRNSLYVIRADTTEVIVPSLGLSEGDIRLILEPESMNEETRNDTVLVQLDGTSAPRICDLATVNDAIAFSLKARLPAWMKETYVIGAYTEHWPNTIITWGRRDTQYDPDAVTRGLRVWLACPILHDSSREEL